AVAATPLGEPRPAEKSLGVRPKAPCTRAAASGAIFASSEGMTKSPFRRLVGAASVYAALRVAARRWRESRYSLSGRVVLITGGSRGLGLLLAREYGRRGARLALAARDAAALDRACDELRRRGAEA